MHHFREMLQRLALKNISKPSVLYVKMADLVPGLCRIELRIWISILGPPIYQCSFFYYYLQFHENIFLLLFVREGEET